MNPELSQLGDDVAQRRRQARMTNSRRDGKSSTAHTKKHRRNRSGQTRVYHQDQDQVDSHSGNPGNPYTSENHGGSPPSIASSAPVAAPGMRLGADHNPSGNPNARQPSTLRTRNDSSTTVRYTPPVRRQRCRGLLRLFRKMHMYLLPACPITQHILPLL